jgi:Holliday junction resolvase RusA-like endonuclease
MIEMSTAEIKANKAFSMRKRIGSTVYDVNLFFNPDASEKLNDKIMRLVKRDLNTFANDGRIVLSFTVALQKSMPNSGSFVPNFNGPI